MTRLALLRHGHTPWNRAGRIQGRSDIALDAQARADLAALSLPAPWDRAALWSSPLARAFDTARLVAGRDPQTDPALTEMNWGAWEGQHGYGGPDDYPRGVAAQAPLRSPLVKPWAWR